MEACRADQPASSFLREGPNVTHQILDLLRLQALPVAGHFVLAIGDDFRQLGIAQLLDVC
jgi:hypothetical protein